MKSLYGLICHTSEVNLYGQGLGHSFVVKCLLSMHDILGSILSIKKKEKE